MIGDELFPHLPVQMNARAVETGNPRLREPVRDQVELRKYREPIGIELRVDERLVLGEEGRDRDHCRGFSNTSMY